MSIFEQLAAPFDPDRVSWRVGATSGDKSKGLALAYIDARDVMQRLDEVVGAGGWQCNYPHAGAKTVCSIGIKVGEEWIWKSNGAGDSDVEAEKGALSDALKRAAVMWGIGRYLYDVDSPWVQIEAMGRSFKIKDSEKPKLRAVLGGSRKQAAAEPETPKARYLADANAMIEKATAPSLLLTWFNSETEKQKRRFANLSQTEVDVLRSAVIAKKEILERKSA